MGGAAPPSSFLVVVCAVLCFLFLNILFLFLNILFEACVCFVFEVCVGVVPRVCEAMEAASAPAGKPPAKRLGKHRASHPSDLNDFLKKSTLFSR